MYHNKSQLNPVKHSRSRLSTTEAAPRNPPWPSWALAAWLPDGYSRIFRSYVIGPSGFWTMATLQNLIPSFPWIAPPHPPPWHNPRKGRDQILPSGNLVWDNRIHHSLLVLRRRVDERGRLLHLGVLLGHSPAHRRVHLGGSLNRGTSRVARLLSGWYNILI